MLPGAIMPATNSLNFPTAVDDEYLFEEEWKSFNHAWPVATFIVGDAFKTSAL
jgi:hypothetical protein